jgi:hypothetical protein
MDFAKLIAKIDSIESKQSLNEGWEDMMKAVDKEGKHKEKEKGTGKFDKKEVSTGTVYTRKSSTFDDGGDDRDTKKAKKDARKAKKDKADESVEELDETGGAAVNAYMAGKSPALAHFADQLDKDAEGDLKEWGAGMDAVENRTVEDAITELKKYASDVKMGQGFIKADNTEVSVSRDNKVALADLNKAVRTLKGVSANTLRSVSEEDMEEGIEDRIGTDLEAETDPAKQNSFNTPAVQRKAQAGGVAANDTMNRLRTLSGQPPKLESVEPVEEDDVEEGNQFSGALKAAKDAGKDDFEVDGKKYKVKEAEELGESAAPGQEDWIKSNKDKFIKQYGKTKGEEVLYATAWNRNKAVKESLQFEECYDQAMSQQSQQESGMNISSNLDTKTGNKSLTVTAQGAAAEQLAQILKLSGMQAQAQDEEPMEEYANTPEPVIQGMEVQMQQGNDLNRPKQTYPKVAGGDNPMAMAEAAELAAIEKRLMEELDSIKIVSEKTTKGAKPDFLDINKNGNKKEPMKKAVADVKKKGK